MDTRKAAPVQQSPLDILSLKKQVIDEIKRELEEEQRERDLQKRREEEARRAQEIREQQRQDILQGGDGLLADDMKGGKTK